MIDDRPMERWLADIGNSRIKWSRIDASGELARSKPLGLVDASEWLESLHAAKVFNGAAWTIASVNPPVAERFLAMLRSRGHSDLRFYESAATVPVRMTVKNPETAGADRALAALAAIRLFGDIGPGLVISCGTAITIERVTADGIWEGGAIAAGLSLAARSLHQSTAQLPFINTVSEVSAWGDSTAPAIAAGVFWGTIGTVRELVARQGGPRWRVWTGGDADVLARTIETSGERFHIVPDLVLRGLSIAEELR